MKKAFRVAEIDGRDTYRLLAGLIVPRPIGWIGTMRPDGVKNLAPYSFFNMIGDEPPLVMFAAGLASLLWMAALTALMIHEKTRPSGARAVPVTGVALLALASVVLAYGAATAGGL